MKRKAFFRESCNTDVVDLHSVGDHLDKCLRVRSDMSAKREAVTLLSHSYRCLVGLGATQMDAQMDAPMDAPMDGPMDAPMDAQWMPQWIPEMVDLKIDLSAVNCVHRSLPRTRRVMAL